MIDFHNHTFLCGHASGTPIEYAQNAIEKRIKIFGFSDHAPLPEHLRKDVSMAADEAEKYISMIEDVRDAMRGSLDIRIGFEVDFPFFDTFEKEYFTDERLDYLIGSCHLIDELPVDYDLNLKVYEQYGVDGVYQRYYEILLDLAKSGSVDIIGHIDLPKKFKYFPSQSFLPIIEKIARAAAKSATAVEVNTAGIRKPVGEMYPSREILEIMRDAGVMITLGSDSHAPHEAGMDIDRACSLLKSMRIASVAAFAQRKPVEILI